MNQQWHPSWSKVERIESGGRYPLGLNRFHNGLEDILIKSITVGADRLRYITYYCWAIGDCHKNDQKLSYKEFVVKFRLKENALAIGLQLLQPAYSHNGSNNPKVRGVLGENECNLNFPLMESNTLGAFGLYYVGPMRNLGLIEINNLGVYSLTKKGEILYKVYEKYLISQKPEYYKKYKDKETVSTNVLLNWGRVNDLDNISGDLCKKERDIYKSLLFHLNKKKVSGYRRHSFCIFLELIDQCISNNSSFTEDVLRTAQYYKNYYADDDTKHKFNPPTYLSDALFYWRIYEGHGYFRGWLLKYFQVFLEYLKSQDKGATIEEFFNEIEKKELNKVSEVYVGQNKEFMNMTLNEIFNLYDKEVGLESPISAESLMQNEETDTKNTVLVKFVLTVVSVLAKFEKIRSDEKYLYVQSKRSEDLWFDRLFFIPSLKKLKVQKFLEICLKEYIVRQHELIMFEKRDLRRCWFTKENDKYFFEAEVSPMWRPAKYKTLTNFLRDMNLIEEKENKLNLTGEGKNLYKTLKKGLFL